MTIPLDVSIPFTPTENIEASLILANGVIGVLINLFAFYLFSRTKKKIVGDALVISMMLSDTLQALHVSISMLSSSRNYIRVF